MEYYYLNKTSPEPSKLPLPNKIIFKNKLPNVNMSIILKIILEIN